MSDMFNLYHHRIIGQQQYEPLERFANVFQDASVAKWP